MPDLSPENLRQRTDGTWAIVDVGHLSLPNIADHQNTIFDERYTAPEIKYTSEVDKNKSASPESEVYSLSLVVWKSLSGVDNDPVDQSITFKKSDEYSPQIIEVLMRGASRNPKDRYPNPTAFAEALKVAAFPQPLVNL